MARDIELQLEDAATHAAGTEYSDVVSCEGGFRADIVLQIGDISTTSDTVDITVEFSPDEGSTYYNIGAFPQLNDAEDEELRISRPVFIPKPDVAGTLARVRLKVVVSAGGSCDIDWAFVEPLTSLAPNADDVDRGVGIAALT